TWRPPLHLRYLSYLGYLWSSCFRILFHPCHPWFSFLAPSIPAPLVCVLCGPNFHQNHRSDFFHLRMIVPKFWAEARLPHREPGRQVTVRRFGWSDTSEAEAQAHAETR